MSTQKAKLLVEALLESEDIDWTPRPEDPDYSASASTDTALRWNQLKKWRPVSHHDYSAFALQVVVPVFTNTGHLSKRHSWTGHFKMRGFTYDNPPSWEQQVAYVGSIVPHKLPGFDGAALARKGFRVGTPYDPVREVFYTPNEAP